MHGGVCKFQYTQFWAHRAALPFLHTNEPSWGYYRPQSERASEPDKREREIRSESQLRARFGQAHIRGPRLSKVMVIARLRLIFPTTFNVNAIVTQSYITHATDWVTAVSAVRIVCVNRRHTRFAKTTYTNTSADRVITFFAACFEASARRHKPARMAGSTTTATQLTHQQKTAFDEFNFADAEGRVVAGEGRPTRERP